MLGTLNADRTSGAILSLEEGCCGRGGRGHPPCGRWRRKKAGVDAGRADLLSNWLLRTRGFSLYLDGALAVRFSYLELLGILDLPNSGVGHRPQAHDRPDLDDSPSNNTTHIVELLQFYNSQATLLCGGQPSRITPAPFNTAPASGENRHPHTWESTPSSPCCPPREDLRSAHPHRARRWSSTPGSPAPRCGPPAAPATTVKQVAGQLGYLVNWSVDTEDWKTRDVPVLQRHHVRRAYDGPSCCATTSTSPPPPPWTG